MQRLLFVLMTGLLALLAPAPTTAQDIGPGPHVALRLEAETTTPAAGSTVTLAFVARPDEGWHGYWKNPGDAGVETQLKWTLPEGVGAGPLQYPVPQRLLIAGLMNYVYEGRYAQLVELSVPAGLAPGTRLPVKVTMDYLVCTAEVCVPETKDMAIDLTVGDGAVAVGRRATFDGYRRALPRPLSAAATWDVADGMFRLAVPFPGGAASREGYFYPLTNGAVDYAAPQLVSRRGDLLVVETKAASGKGVTGPVEGVLALGDGGGFLVRAQPGGVAASPPAEAGAGWATALWAFGGAVLGGLLLNIMPCVFPILSLKALSLARAGETEGHARSEALAYTAGVVLVCVALGAVLLGLRAAGASAGWAFQLQDPRVILLLLLLTFAIALNLAGLFEVGTPGVVNRMAAEGRGGAFATGALAAFIATPCTGPFMGAALGAALLLPAIGALAVFAGLGLGLALPFLLLGFVPALRRRLPRPGAWMETFRHILSVPMFLTALALAWVLGRQAGVDAMTLGLGAALLLGVGLWWTGRRQAGGRERAWWPAVPALALALMAAATVRQAPAEAREVAAPAGAEPFSEERLAALNAEGRPVFAYFTADWCLTCKVNEKAVIETAAVRDALKGRNVAVLVGDWTDGDPALGRFIEKHNRAGVPLYLWYKPGGGAPEVLPQLLTQDMLVRRARA